MTIRSGLVVLIKCFMILLAFQLLMWLVASLGAADIPLRFIAAAAIILVPLMLVYWLAEAVVDLMTPKSNDVLVETPVQFDDLQAIGFSAVGAFILYSAIQQSIYVIIFLWQNQTTGILLPVPSDLYSKPIISWIVGGYLLVGAPAIRRGIGAMRRARSSGKGES